MSRGEPRAMQRPETGYWLIRLRRGAPEVPACIRYERTTYEPGLPDNRMDRSPILTARINGDIVPWERVWLTRGRAIDRAEYDYRVAVTEWAIENAPDDPAADATRPIDLLTASLPF